LAGFEGVSQTIPQHQTTRLKLLFEVSTLFMEFASSHYSLRFKPWLVCNPLPHIRYGGVGYYNS